LLPRPSRQSLRTAGPDNSDAIFWRLFGRAAAVGSSASTNHPGPGPEPLVIGHPPFHFSHHVAVVRRGAIVDSVYRYRGAGDFPEYGRRAAGRHVGQNDFVRGRGTAQRDQAGRLLAVPTATFSDVRQE
jgi:hypothetical protein